MPKGIIFFDCDGTLRASEDNDWLGSAEGPVLPDDEMTVMRGSDGKRFRLSSGARGVLEMLIEKGYELGVVSDNPEAIVLAALAAFRLDVYFNTRKIGCISMRTKAPLPTIAWTMYILSSPPNRFSIRRNLPAKTNVSASIV